MSPGTTPLTSSEQQPPTIALTTTFSRRYACDRCRGHKLRCNRDLTASLESPCQRCRKAKAKCTIGLATQWRQPGQRKSRTSANKELSEHTTAIENNVNEPQPLDACQLLARNPPRSDSIEPHERSDWIDLFQNTGDSSVALDSISWQDVFGPATSALGSRFTLPTPTSPTAMSPSQSARQENPNSNYVFDTLTAGSTLDLSSASTSSVQAAAKRRRRDSVGLDMIENNHSSETVQLSASQTGTSELGSMQLLSNMDDNSAWAKEQPKRKPGITFTSLSDQCIGDLSNLGSKLMMELHRIIELQATTSCVLGQSNAQRENTIGNMLQFSERFLNIMRSVNTPHYGRYFPCSEEILSIDDEAYNSTEMEDTSGMDMNTAAQFQHKPDLPSTFSILACYTSLTQIYEMVFSSIKQSLQTSNTVAMASELPKIPSIHGMHINGFMLQNHHTLQLKILIQVSRYMLDSIDKVLRRTGVLDDSMFQALLKAGLQRPIPDVASVDLETGLGLVQDHIREIEDCI